MKYVVIVQGLSDEDKQAVLAAICELEGRSYSPTALHFYLIDEVFWVEDNKNIVTHSSIAYLYGNGRRHFDGPVENFCIQGESLL